MRKDKISKFQKDVFNQLINRYEFCVDELNVNGKETWFAMKYIGENQVYVVTISTNEDKCVADSFLKNYFKEKGLLVVMNSIVPSRSIEFDDKKVSNEISIDVNSRKIVAYNDVSRPIVIILEEILAKPLIKKKTLKERVLDFNKRTPIITKCILGINIWAFVVTALVGVLISGDIIENLMQINSQVLYISGAKVNYLIMEGHQWWRVITHMFLHGGLIHLVFNMYALYILGPGIEMLLGKVKFILVYLLSGIVSCMFSIKFSSGFSVGASGAIFGLLGITLVFAYLNKNRSQMNNDLLKNILFLIGINLFIGFNSIGIDNAGHIGGLIAGIFIGYFGVKKDLVKKAI
ncbi:MAG: rhomboid family intramembrane serine protease [Sarcina sp.]